MRKDCFNSFLYSRNLFRLFVIRSSELLRYNAFFYGFFYDRKQANYKFLLSCGVKQIYSILFPFFFFNLNNLKIFNKFLKKIEIL